MIFNMMDNARRSKGLELAYTGTMTQSSITVDGAAYTLYTLTTSGTLTVVGRGKNIGVWICGGGARGGSGSYTSSSATGGYGGAGAYCAQYTGSLGAGEYTVQIASADGSSSFGGLLSTLTVSGKNGGTGGGGSGTGDGISKYPFGDTTNFEPHCGGGGGGRTDSFMLGDISATLYPSGYGGTNGGNGGSSGSGYTGGKKGGGNGGSASASSEIANAGSKATFYGSGGGGGSAYAHSQFSGKGASGGSGYQGVMYIRVPA